MLKLAFKGYEGGWLVFYVPSDLGGLAVEASLAPQLNLFLHALAGDLISHLCTPVSEKIEQVNDALTQVW